MKKQNKAGISLISLIITIIVIIILAAIVIFTGLNTPDRANFAKFTQTISDFRTAITQDFMQKKAQYAIEGKTRSDAQIYYIIAKGEDSFENNINDTLPSGEGAVADLNGLKLEGERYYQITSDANVANWKKQTQYYEPSEKHYVTDKGDVFVLGGYRVEENGGEKWYVNERAYSDTKVTGPLSIQTTDAKVTTDTDGNNVPANGVTEEGTTLYITFNASIEGGTVNISPALPFAITKDGTYTFNLSSEVNGKTVTATKTVPVSGVYKEKLLSETYAIGDYVDYHPTVTSDTPLASETGSTTNTEISTVDTEAAMWRILYVDNANKQILITPGIIASNKVELSKYVGYYKGPAEIDRLCTRLYSNTAKGITARSMTIEDLNKACGNTSTGGTSYVYYASNSEEGYTAGGTVEKDGITYAMTVPSSSTRRFYTGNGANVTGGEEGEYTDNGISYPYRTPVVGKPVYVQNTHLNYSYPKTTAKPVKSVINYTSTSGWLASPCVNADSSSAYFRVRSAYSSSVGAGNLLLSSGGANSYSCGLLPLVSLSSELLTGTGISSNTNQGKTAANAWGVK